MKHGESNLKECQETANIVLSIKPQYASLILSGEKRYEYRKSIPKRKSPESTFM